MGGLRRLLTATILGALTAFGPFSIDMYLPSLPRISSDFHTSASMIQLTLTFCLIGLAAGQLIAGPISDAFGRRRPLLVGLLVYSVTSFLCVFTQSVWLFIFLRLFQGLAGATGIVIANAVARDHYNGPELTKFYALLMLVNGAAPIVAPIVGGQILRFTDWKGVFVVLTAVGIAMIFAVMFGLPESLPKQSRSSGGLIRTLRTFKGLFQNRMFMGYTWARGFVTAAMFGYIAGSPFVLQQIFGVSPQTFSLIFAMNGLGIIIGSQVSPRLAIRYREQAVLTGGLFLAAIGSLILFLALVFNAGLVGVLPPLFVCVACVGVVSTTSTSLALQSQAKQTAGSAGAVIGLAGMLAGGVVTPLVGLGGSQSALPMALVIAICDVAGALGYIGLASIRIRRPSKT